MLIGGIDEAGRGPVIGPMVITGVVYEEKNLGWLRKDGVKDSKLLQPGKRRKLYQKIIKQARSYEIIKISPEKIDQVILKSGSNLNWLEGEKTAEILNKLRPNKAIVDCPSPNAWRYRTFVQKRLNYQPELLVEHKADANHIIVAAASVVAKVVRDAEILRIKKKIGIDFGSGYASDLRTQEFLKKNYNTFTEIFRKSWSSYQRLKKGGKTKQKKLGEY